MKEKAIFWYKQLHFPKEYDEAFYALAEGADLSAVDVENPIADLQKKADYGLNLIYFLACCEDMHKAYCERGIPEEIFNASAHGLVLEAQLCQQAFGKIGVYEVAWFNEVICRQRIMRIGRLQFEMRAAGEEFAGDIVQKDDSVLSVHIPGHEPLTMEACREAFQKAKQFFTAYYPEFTYTCFVCDSWMLDESLDAYLGATSNIRNFRKLFTIYKTKEGDDALKFVLGRTVTRKNIADFKPKTGLQTKLQQHVAQGGKLYVCCGKREARP